MSGGYDDYDSDCDYYDYDDDYIYADAGGFDLADELASGAIPEAPAMYYRDDELISYDNYNFWSEIEYGNNEMFDQEVELHDMKNKSRAEEIKDKIKKIRLRGIQDYPTVLWKSSQEAFNSRQPCPVYTVSQELTALLPHWRQLLKHLPAYIPPSNVSAAENHDQDAEWDHLSDSNAEEGEDDDDDEENDDGEYDQEDIHLQQIDPEMLQSALAANLSASGMAGKDQSAMMEAMMQTLSGGASTDTDNLLESLTSSVLNKVTEEGGDSSMGQWLSGQGVTLEDNIKPEEQEQETASLPTTTSSKASSPKDSVAAEPPAAPKSSELPIEALLEPPSTGKKRKHPLSEEFNQEQSPDVTAPGSSPTRKRAKQDTSKSTVTSSQPKVSTRKPPVPQTKANKTDEKTTTKPKASINNKAKADPTKATKHKPQANQITEAAPSSDEPAKPTTRKRKATEDQTPEDKPKRQLRNFAAPTTSSQSKAAESKAPEPKTTRSGKSKK